MDYIKMVYEVEGMDTKEWILYANGKAIRKIYGFRNGKGEFKENLFEQLKEKAKSLSIFDLEDEYWTNGIITIEDGLVIYTTFCFEGKEKEILNNEKLAPEQYNELEKEIEIMIKSISWENENLQF